MILLERNGGRAFDAQRARILAASLVHVEWTLIEILKLWVAVQKPGCQLAHPGYVAPKGNEPLLQDPLWDLELPVGLAEIDVVLLTLLCNPPGRYNGGIRGHTCAQRSDNIVSYELLRLQAHHLGRDAGHHLVVDAVPYHTEPLE